MPIQRLTLSLIAILTMQFVLMTITMHTAAAVVVDADTVREAVADTCAAVTARSGLDIEYVVGGCLNVAVDGIDAPQIVVESPDLNGARNRVRVPVLLTDGGGTVLRRVHVFVRVSRFAEALVAADTVKRRDPVTAADVMVSRVEVTGIDNVLTDTAAIGNMRAARPLRPGRVLTARDIEPIPLVDRGDRVTILASVGGVKLVAGGVAREGGGINQIIRVYNETTHATLECSVVDARTVRVRGPHGG